MKWWSKNERKTLVAYALLVISLAACSDTVSTSLPGTITPIPATSTPKLSNSPNPTTTEVYPTFTATAFTATVTEPKPAPSSTIEIRKNTKYTLSAVLDYGQHHLSVEEQINYINHSPDVLSNLPLTVEATRYVDVFHLNSLTWADGQPVTGTVWDKNQLWLPLRNPLQPDESVVLYISYELALPSPTQSESTRPIPFGYTARQTNLVDWYPFVPPYTPGQGWLVHPPGFFGEHLVYDTADYQVDIRLTNAGEDSVIAASAPSVTEGDRHQYQLQTARNFVWSVSHDYQVFTKTVGMVTILSYAFPFDTIAGETVLKETANALELYIELFGPYPHSTLTIVEADFLDGMEYDGLYFLSNALYNTYSGTPADFLTAIAVHETAHQWWYGVVGNDQALEPWLDEALSTYSERLFFERTYPEALDWWWTYRVNYYEPSGWVDNSIYNPEGYLAYRNAVYLNGAIFLENLRTLVGDEAFFNFIQAYVVQNTHNLVTAEDFFSLLSEFTQVDLAPLVEEYFMYQ